MLEKKNIWSRVQNCWACIGMVGASKYEVRFALRDLFVKLVTYLFFFNLVSGFNVGINLFIDFFGFYKAQRCYPC